MKMKKSSILKKDISELIQELEEYCGICFPDSYSRFISKNNVGIPVTNQFKCGEHLRMITRFLGFVEDYETSPLGSYDIEVVLSQIDTRLSDDPDSTEDELIPIAELFAGDYVCLDFRENKKEPSVCVWAHEESDVFSPTTYWVADTFSDFLEMLI